MVSEEARSTDGVEDCTEQLALAESYLATGLVNEATEVFQSVLVISGEPEALMGMARCMYHLRRLHEALSHLQQLAVVDPQFPELANNMGVILFEMGLLEQAREQFEHAAEECPENTVTWLNLIDLARKAEDDEGREKYCRRLLEVEPGNLEALEFLGQRARPPF